MAWNLNKWANETWAWVDGIFTEEELDAIVKSFADNVAPQGTVSDVGKTDIKIRDSNVLFIPQDAVNEYIYQKLDDATVYLNQYFEYDLTHIETAQFTIYKEGQYYTEHKDWGYKNNRDRKLSLVVQLTDENNYEGGELVLYDVSHAKPTEMSKKRGRVVAFPSWLLHEVKPVTKGTRHSLVAWVCGPRFK